MNYHCPMCEDCNNACDDCDFNSCENCRDMDCQFHPNY
jgi:hypothetical protein